MSVDSTSEATAFCPPPRGIKHKLEQTADEYVATWTKKRAAYLKHKEMFNDLYGQLVGFVGHVGLSSDFDVRLAGGKEELYAVVKIIRQAGFICQSDHPAPGATEWASFWKHPASELKIYFHFSSTVCKRVQVGTRMEAVPIYETQCDNDPTTFDQLDAPRTSVVPAEPDYDDSIPF